MGWTMLILTLALFIYIVSGIKIIREQERWVIEFFGKFWKVKGPGLRLVLPGLMRVRAVVNIWEQMVSLFEEPIKIDFIDGSAVPRDAMVFVRISSPDKPYKTSDERNASGVYRTVYFISDWRKAVKNEIENAVRSYLNGMTIDKGITEKGAGYDLTNHMEVEEVNRIREALKDWGLELLRITIMDFDLEPDLVEARGKLLIQQRKAQGAQYEKETRALETMGSLIQMIAVATGRSYEKMQEEIKRNPKLTEELTSYAKELVSRQMSIDGLALTDIRVSGGGNLEQSILQLIGALKSSQKGDKKK